MLALYKMTFYTARYKRDEEINLETYQDMLNLKNALLEQIYIKDLKVFKYDKKRNEYKEIRL